MSKDNEKEIKEKKTLEKKEEKVVDKKETLKEDSKKVEREKEKKEVKKEVSKKEETKKVTKKKKLRVKKASNEEVEVITQDSPIREKVMILGSFLLQKIKEYKYVIGLDIAVYLLLFFLIPQVIFDVKPFIWMTAFVLFTVLPTIGIYGMKKFRDKQILFGFFFIYVLILLFIKKFTIIDLYGITSHGKLDYTPAWLDAVFVTCIILFFQYIGILIVNLTRKAKRKNKKN